MSSNYQGRGRGSRGRTFQAGRGHGRSKPAEGSKTTKESDIKFTPYGTWGGKTTMTFDTVKDHILQVIQKTYKAAWISSLKSI